MYKDTITQAPFSDLSQKYFSLTIESDKKLFFPSQTQNPENCLSKVMDISASNPDLSIILPEKLSGYTGYRFTFINVGSNSFDIKDNDLNKICTVGTLDSVTIIVDSNNDFRISFYSYSGVSQVSVTNPYSGFSISPSYLDANGSFTFQLSDNLLKIESLESSSKGILRNTTSSIETCSISSSTSNIYSRNIFGARDGNIKFSLLKYIYINSAVIGGINLYGNFISNLSSKINSSISIKKNYTFNSEILRNKINHLIFSQGLTNTLLSYSLNPQNEDLSIIFPDNLSNDDGSFVNSYTDGRIYFSSSCNNENILTPKDFSNNSKGIQKNVCSTFILFNSIGTENGFIKQENILSSFNLKGDDATNTSIGQCLYKDGVGKFYFNFSNVKVNNFYMCTISASNVQLGCNIVSNFQLKNDENFFYNNPFVEINLFDISGSQNVDCEYIGITITYD